MSKSVDKNKKSNNIRRGSKGEDPAAELAAQQEYARKLAAESSSVEAENSEGILQAAIAETGKKVMADIAPVLDLKPSEPPEAIDSAILQSNSDQTHALAASTEDQLKALSPSEEDALSLILGTRMAAVTAKPSLSPTKKPATIVESPIKADTNQLAETEINKENNRKVLENIKSILDNLNELLNSNYKSINITDGDLYTDKIGFLENNYSKYKKSNTEGTLIDTSSLEILLNKANDTLAKFNAELPKMRAEFAAVKTQPVVEATAAKTPPEVAVTTEAQPIASAAVEAPMEAKEINIITHLQKIISERLKTYSDLIEKIETNNLDDKNKKIELGPTYKNFESITSEKLIRTIGLQESKQINVNKTIEELEKISLDIASKLKTVNEIINSAKKSAHTEPVVPDTIATEKPKITLQEWQNNRDNKLQSLLDRYPDMIGAQVENPLKYAAFYREKIEPEMDRWERNNQRPFILSNGTETKFEFQEILEKGNESETDKEKNREILENIKARIDKILEYINSNFNLIDPQVRNTYIDKTQSLNLRYSGFNDSNERNAVVNSIFLNNLLKEANDILLEFTSKLPKMRSEFSAASTNGATAETPAAISETSTKRPSPQAPENLPVVSELRVPPIPPIEPPPIPETAPAANNERLAVINIANRARLKEQLVKEAAKRNETLTPDQISERAKNQVEFISATKVKNLIIDIENYRMTRDFKPVGETTKDGLKQELSKLLLSPDSVAKKQSLNLLAAEISNNTGLNQEDVLQIINNQEQHLADLAKAEVNAGRVVGATEEQAQANVRYDRKKTLAKMGFYLGGGVLASILAPGVGSIGAIYGARVVDNLFFSNRKKNKAKLAELKSQVETNIDTRDNFIQRLFTDIAAAQQNRISETKFDFKSFLTNNSDLIANYSDKEIEQQLIPALKVIENLEKDTYNRENDLLDRMSNKIKKSDNRLIRFGDAIATGFNKYIFRGGETNREKAVSAAMLGGAAMAARELPIIREVLAAMGGYKLGDIAANKLLGVENTEKRQITDRDTAIDILNMAVNRSALDFSTKNKKLAIKLTAAVSAGLLAHYLPDAIRHLTEKDATSPAVNLPAHEVAPPSAVGAGAVVAVEAPKIDHFADAVKEMQTIDGSKAHHIWGLTELKIKTLSEHLGDKDLGALVNKEGSLTYITDGIKDKIAEHPESFGLPKSFNIDRITAEQLASLSKNDHFNETIVGILKEGSLADQAAALPAEAIKHIEANNAFNQQVVEHLPKNINLDQAAYNEMSALHTQGLSAEATAQALQQAHETASHATAGAGSAVEQVTTGSVSAPEVSPSSVAEHITAPRSEIFPVGSTLENFQDIKTMAEWNRISEFMAGSNNERGISKSLDSIFRHLGLSNEYSAPDAADFVIKNTNYKGGTLNFDVPAPINYQAAEQVGDMHFSYDANKNEMMGYVGDESISLKNVKNIDKGIKTIFTVLADKINI